MSFPGNWKISATRIMTSVLYTFLVTQNFSFFYNAAKFNTEHFSPLIMSDLVFQSALQMKPWNHDFSVIIFDIV